jgi:hypothetical protein
MVITVGFVILIEVMTHEEYVHTVLHVLPNSYLSIF